MIRLFIKIVFLISLTLTGCNTESKVEKLSENQQIIQQKEVDLLSEYENHIYKDFSLPKFKFESPVSYSTVQKIISENCLHCHKPNGNAPFSLMTYNDVQKRAQTIREVISTKRMPPWMADDSYSHLFNSPRIRNKERAQIVQWIDKGAQLGDPIPEFHGNSSTSLENKKLVADQVLKRAEDYTIISNNDSYECFIYTLDNEEDFYLSGVEFMSSNPEVIHHQMLFLDTGNVVKRDETCWDCKNDGIVNEFVPISSWSKGMRPIALNDKLAYRIPKGSKFILQTHYGDEGNKGRKENTTLRLFHSKKFEEIVEFTILNKLDILYKKGEIKPETLTYEITENTSLLGVIPHMHFLTKKIEIYAIDPDKKIIPILKIPEWDYLWQCDFILDSPIHLPKGSLVVISIIVDNTETNPTQPNFPIRNVKYGTNSPDEMFVLVLINKPYKKGDEDLKVARYIQ